MVPGVVVAIAAYGEGSVGQGDGYITTTHITVRALLLPHAAQVTRFFPTMLYR